MYLKVLNKMKACQGGNFEYTPGEWTPKIEEPECCQRGYHTTDEAHLLEFLFSCDSVWECEGEGPSDERADKTAWSSIRLVRQLMGRYEIWMLRADIAEHVLPIYEKAYPDDDRVRSCIEAIRAYARGEIDQDTLRKAAAYADAADAANADAAAYAVYAANAAAYAAYADAYAAVYAADADAAVYAADADEREWQQERVRYWLEYREEKETGSVAH